LDSIIVKLIFDKEMLETMYKIDYNRCWYDENFHRSEGEPSVDQFLSFLNYTCYLRKIGVIRKNEFKIIQYELNRVCKSPSVQGYLWNLYHFSKKDCVFQYLIDYGIKRQYIPQDFYEQDTSRYKKYLNF